MTYGSAPGTRRTAYASPLADGNVPLMCRDCPILAYIGVTLYYKDVKRSGRRDPKMTNAKMYFIEQELASYVDGYRDDYDLDAMFDAMKDDGLVVWDGDNYTFADGADFDIVDYLQRFDVSGKPSDREPWSKVGDDPDGHGIYERDDIDTVHRCRLVHEQGSVSLWELSFWAYGTPFGTTVSAIDDRTAVAAAEAEIRGFLSPEPWRM